MDNAPRPKSGVYAVRQGPILAENLQRACLGQPLRRYRPQGVALSIISTGDKFAIANRGPWSFGGRWVWRWKDWIDRRFMQKYQELPTAMMSARKSSSAALEAELAQLGDVTMRCAGCGSKVGSDILSNALRNLQPTARPDVVIGLDAPDDAAVVALPADRLAVHTIDGFRTFISDPYLFGMITVAHCVSDIYAMGATPQSALAYVTLPVAAARVSENELSLLLAGVKRALDHEKIALVGGHTNEGPELSLALAVNGHVAPHQLRRKGGAQIGDVLILTKPLGAGVILAGAMQGMTSASTLDEALQCMAHGHGDAARVLTNFEIHAMTDVTGFGLAGHLREMLRASGHGAALDPSRVPMLSGAIELITRGVRSTLHPQNESSGLGAIKLTGEANTEQTSLLFDPQTSGGLLIALSTEVASAAVKSLHSLNYRAAVIGEIVPEPLH